MRELKPVWDLPPMCLLYFWLFVCGIFHQPEAADKLFYWVRVIFMALLSFGIIYDSLFYVRSCFRRLVRPVLRPQSGFQRVDPYLKEAVQVWCLFESLKDCRTKRGMIAAITQYLQAHVSESLPFYIYRLIMRVDYITDWTEDKGMAKIEEMLEEAFNFKKSKTDPNEEELILEAQDGDVPWHVAMDMAFKNWKEFRTSPIAQKFTHLINVIVSSGMCATADLTFKVGNVALFTPIVSKRQLAAGDVFEAFYEAVAGFMKGGWRVYQTGEVSAFFVEDDNINEFDKMYSEIRSLHGYALTGNLIQYSSIDDNEYECRIKKAIEFGDNLSKSIKRTQFFEKKYVTDRLDRLRDYEIEFTQLRTRGGLRIAPFAICLFGQSGCGKSSLTNLTVNTGLIYNGLSAAKDRIASWADNDKFASAIRSHINAIIFDDFANTREEFMDFSPAYRLIQVINNIKYLAPMADVFLKGKVSLNPYFCIISTNVEHLNAAKYSNEPESVLRRMYHVKVEPKPEFCGENGILCKHKIEAKFGNTSCPDVWYLTVRRYRATNIRSVNPSAFQIIYFGETRMRKVSVYKYLEWVQVASKAHFDAERKYVANQEVVPEICKKCDMVYCKCNVECSEEVSEETPGRFTYNPETGAFEIPHTIPQERRPALAANVQHMNAEWQEMLRRGRQAAAEQGIPLAGAPISNADPVKPEPTIAEIPPLATGPFPILLEKQSGENPQDGEWEYEGNRNFFHRRAEYLQHRLEEAKTKSVLASNAVCMWWEKFDCMPEKYICHPTVLKFGLLFWRESILDSLIAGNTFFMFMLLILCYVCPYLSYFWVFCVLGIMYWYTCSTVQTYKNMIRNRMLELKDIVRTYTKQWQFKYGLIGLGGIMLVLSIMRARHASLETHTGLDPKSIEEVQERNDKANPWLVAECVPLPMSEPARTTTADNLAASMKTNLIGLVSGINKTTLGFYITSNFLVVPTHFLAAHGDGDISVRCYKNMGPDKVGHFFKDKISKAFCVNVPGTDFTVCFVTGGGSMKDFRKFLPEGNYLKRTPAKLVTREVTDATLQAIPTLFGGSERIQHTQMAFTGGYYKLQVDTKPGMCMSPLISDSKGSLILGFHLGGRGNLGGCGILTQDQVNFAIRELALKDGVVLSASSGNLNPHMGDFPTETYGYPICEGAEIHPKSAVNFLDEGACIDVYGKTSGKATPYSRVAPTVISEAVHQVFGVPQKWGPPKMKGKGRYPYQETLVHSACPSMPIGSVLSQSVRSMKELTTDLKERIPALFDVGPLSRVATVCGLDGVKFIDAMNFSTSPGFPLSGTKQALLEDLDPDDYPDITKPRTFKAEVWEEFDKAVETLRNGKRYYAIWKSCLKDEATKLTKDKVRVFQSAPLALQLLIRMYFLPIVRIIQMNPILYECAVGVNAEGLEWEELWEAAMSKGKERVLAGDYSKYDARMPAQVTIAAFDILIDIASRCSKYMPEDIHLMTMLVNEITYPVMAYNGDLIQLFGTNPSGQNLTVIINSIVNSLLLRSCFFTFYPGRDFKENCSFLTYGDDVIGTVDESCSKFTHITYADWLAEHDMKFTMPDKESTPVHYMTEADVDFLKRKCVFNEDLGRKVGILSEESIFKRLHAHLLSRELTLPEHAAQNIESSLHDWFYYGRDVFEDRRGKFREVAHICGIEHMCPALNVSYDKRVNHWRHKYLGEELEEEEEIVLDVQCGDLYVSTYDYFDHCIGTYLNPFFWWEHVAADLTIPFFIILGIALNRGWYFKFGNFDKRWFYLLAILTGGYRKIFGLFMLFFTACIQVSLAYILGFVILFYVEFIMDLFSSS